MTVEIAALDLFTLFVNYTFGSFFLAVIGLGFVMFVVMGLLGRISIYSTMWYCIMFFLVMAIGYSFIFVAVVITLELLVFVYLAVKKIIDER